MSRYEHIHFLQNLCRVSAVCVSVLRAQIGAAWVCCKIRNWGVLGQQGAVSTQQQDLACVGMEMVVCEPDHNNSVRILKQMCEVH